jgi:hypothetical protein
MPALALVRAGEFSFGTMRIFALALTQISTAAAEMPEGRTGNLRHYDRDKVNIRTF